MNWLRLNRQYVRPTPRHAGRRPILEDLEGRRLLSGIVGNAIGTSIVTSVQVEHVGTPAVQGGQVGTVVADAAILFPVFAQ